MKIFFLFLGSWLVLAAGAVDTPSAGYVRAVDGSIIRVSGVAGAFVTTATAETGSITASFSGRLGLVKMASSIRVLDGAGELLKESDAPEGSALFGFNARGDEAIVYYPSTQTSAILQSGEWHYSPFSPQADTRVLAVALQDSDTALALIVRDGLALIAIRISDGAIADETPVGPGGGPVLLLPDRRIIFLRDNQLIYRDARGCERVLEAQGVLAMSNMDSEWVHARTESGRSLAFRLAQQTQVYQLPEAPQ